MGGELSDIKVIVDGEEFQLHRFPLYTRSDFFLKEFAKLGGQQLVTLDDFPGGAPIFTIIADFCYNISVNITMDNVVGLRCAASYMEMYGSGNLFERTGLLIEQIANDSRHGRNLEKLLTLISTIPEFDYYETTEQTMEICVAALVYHWNKYQYGTTSLYEVTTPEVQKIFFNMEFEFFIKLMQACKDKLDNDDVLSVLVSEYILYILKNDPAEKLEAQNTETADSDEKDKSGSAETTENQSEEDQTIGDDQTKEDQINGDADADSQEPDTLTDDTVSDSDQQSNKDEEEDKPEEAAEALEFSEESLRMIKRLLDAIRPCQISRKMASKWLCPLLEAYSKVDGSNEVLGSIAASMANQMDEDCVATMSQDTLLAFADKVDVDCLGAGTQELIMEHLVNLSDSDQLSIDSFLKLSQKMPLNGSPCHDSLLNIISKLNSNKGKLLSVVKNYHLFHLPF